MSGEVNDVEGDSEIKILNRGYLSKTKLSLQKEATQSWIKFITLIYLAVGAMFSIQYALILLIFNSQIGPGGTAIMTQYAIIPLFASGILAVGLGLFIGKQSDSEFSAVVASGIGTYLGYIGFVLTLVVTTRIVGSDFLSAAIGLTVEGLLSQLIFAGFGIAFVGAGSGYLGYRTNERNIGNTVKTTNKKDSISQNNNQKIDSSEGDNMEGHNPENGPTSSRSIEDYRGIFTDSSIAPTTWLVIYSFALIGAGYGILAVTLGFLMDGIVAMQLTWIASVGIIFSAPLLAAYFGMRAVREHPTREAIKIGFIGGGFGFIILALIMVLFGTFGPDSVLLDDLISIFESVDGLVGALTAFNVAALELIVQLVPYGYEFSRILFIGAIGSAIAGGIAALSIKGSERWV